MRRIGEERRERGEDDTVTALGRVEDVSNGDGHRSKATLIVSLELALIKDLN